jgi:hypothetical protein
VRFKAALKCIENFLSENCHASDWFGAAEGEGRVAEPYLMSIYCDMESLAKSSCFVHLLSLWRFSKSKKLRFEDQIDAFPYHFQRVVLAR